MGSESFKAFLEYGSNVMSQNSGTFGSIADMGDDAVSNKDDPRKRLQTIRIKFLRLAHRLGQSTSNVVVSQVLYRLGLAEQLCGHLDKDKTFVIQRASMLAQKQEASGQNDLEFGCTILALGKSGVGKSATINSLFGEYRSCTNAYVAATRKALEITGYIHGVKLKVIDTPGLLNSSADRRVNEKLMASVKGLITRSPPDIVLYFDRLDVQSREYGDLPLLWTVSDIFGIAIWFNVIIVLTHACSPCPDGTSGSPVSYDMIVSQRSHIVQQAIREVAGDSKLMNPVSLVENHSAFQSDRPGQCILPNGQAWKPQLLLLCFASKILAEANAIVKHQDKCLGGLFGIHPSIPSPTSLLSSLLQPRAQLKVPCGMENMGDSESSDDEADEGKDEEEDDYDALPPFRRLAKHELNLLEKNQKKEYFEELEYRQKLFMMKQRKEARRKWKEMRKKMSSATKNNRQPANKAEHHSASLPAPMPDMILPPLFDSDNPIYRYRTVDMPNQWLVQPVVDVHSWDHDCGYDGLHIEKMFVIKKDIPALICGQVTKDKKEASLKMECTASVKLGEGKTATGGLELQTMGKHLGYTLLCETRFSNFKRNKTLCGMSITHVKDTVAAGMKFENHLTVGKRLKVIVNAGALTAGSDVAGGGKIEFTMKDDDFPISRSRSTLGLSAMNSDNDLSIGFHVHVQRLLGKTLIIGRADLSNMGAGRLSLQARSSELYQMAFIGMIPMLHALLGSKG